MSVIEVKYSEKSLLRVGTQKLGSRAYLTLTTEAGDVRVTRAELVFKI